MYLKTTGQYYWTNRDRISDLTYFYNTAPNYKDMEMQHGSHRSFLQSDNWYECNFLNKTLYFSIVDGELFSVSIMTDSYLLLCSNLALKSQHSL